MAGRLVRSADQETAMPGDAMPDFDEDEGDEHEEYDDDGELDEEEVRLHLPDFLHPDYDLDIPRFRQPLAKAMLTLLAAQEHCPDPACRRARSCLGEGRPACYHADREMLHQGLMLVYLHFAYDLPGDAIAAAMDATGNRYRRPEADGVPEPQPAPRRRRKSRALPLS